jgi:signal transduction histidine kinase
MQRTLSKLLVFIRRFGLKSQETQIETIAANVFNLLLIPLFFVHIFFVARAIIEVDSFALSVNGTAFGVMLVMLVLNFFGKYQASVNYFNLIYPLLAGGISYVTVVFDGLDYTFFVFILTGIIFSKSLKPRIFFTIYNVLIFHLVNQYIISHPAPIARGLHGHDHEILFAMTALSIFAIISYFYGAIIKHEQHNQRLVENLTLNNNKLNTLNQELERFNHIASHDLKTPLRSIMSFSSLIQRDLKKESYDDVDEYFQFIKNSAQQMHSLITNTLEYSQVEQKAIKKEELDLNKIIIDLSRQIKTAYPEDIEINHANLPSYNGNESLLIRLFQNIFENGIKYNKSIKKIIKVDFTIEKSALILEIKDNGIGIEQEYLDKIFVLFKRLHTSTEFTGTGLGLSICKKIVEQLNGSIWANSEIGKGSTFYISLPIDN